MRFILIFSLIFIGCPKAPVNLDKNEKEENLRELIENEDLFDDLPEAGELEEKEKDE
tara:strand:+ start:569 stop:739 length:171 start_codon:yes stop_codon:yes gene_type:complete